MKTFSSATLAKLILDYRKENKMSQENLATESGINRSILSKIEQEEHIPSITQIESLAKIISFDIADLFTETKEKKQKLDRSYNIAVAGTGYVGLSIATLLAQHNSVTAVDIVPEKVELINNKKSPIQDDYIEKYLAEKKLDLVATTDGDAAYKKADFVVIAAPTNYDSEKNYFDTSAVESVIEQVLSVNKDAIMVIKSTIPVGFTDAVRQKFNTDKIIFSPEFLRESKALYDNLYPSRIIVSTDKDNKELTAAAHTFAQLLQDGAEKDDIQGF